MKKTCFFVILLCLCLTSSCNSKSEYVERGLENFGPNDSECGLCSYLIPENLIQQYAYVDGNYYNEWGTYRIIGGWEKVLVYIQYDINTYSEAKKYVMDNLFLSESHVAEYNDYYFFINETPSKTDPNLSPEKFPYDFLRFAYNDNNNTLVFIGFCVSMELYEEVDAVADDWPAFLEKYYGEWYSFS